jgi:ankyrin repeat protein
VRKTVGWLGFAVASLTALACRPGPTSPLAVAAVNGRIGEVDALLAKGTPVDEPDMAGFTPLVWASREGPSDAVKKLLAAGADPLRPAGVNGWSSLQHAVHKGRTETVAVLLATGRYGPRELNESLVMAAGYGNAAAVRALLGRGADPHVEVGGARALPNAVGGAWDIDYRFQGCEPHAETVRALLLAAPDLALGDGSSERSALAYAQRRGCTEIVDLVSRKQGPGTRNATRSAASTARK